MNHVLWSLGDHKNNCLTTFLADSTKYDIVVILVFFSELFDEYPIRGSVRKVFFHFLVGTACREFSQNFSSGRIGSQPRRILTNNQQFANVY